ncbi:PEP-CTERM sorting domain-containing protein [Methylomonas sp. LL1]|uniref:PEP-CTERM sorting domain-containing protein n=1 Tax=Methylomonas sp. LL1 TaxID=2785785 RepID=UPI001E3DB4F3|nr:PEP-CTERM sorting domain-containing protein [Methylomonas sp. LL1]
MKHFAKVAVAAVLMAGAGAANASIAYDQGSNNEAYMSAYDFTTGKTFTFDTGVSFGQLLSNVANAAYSLSFDFSNDSNWLNFITGAATDKIKWAVAVGSLDDLGAMITQNNAVVDIDPAGTFFTLQAGATIQAHAIEINSKVVVNNTQNLSTIALDSEGAGLGQHANAASVWGGHNQDPQADYGQSIGFQLGMMNLDENSPNFGLGQTIPTTFAGKWTLAGNSLTYAAAPAAVPVPGAVWMFGAGLMGLLGLNRRKTAA